MVVADDDVLLREGLASLLERSEFEVVGQAGDADELLDLVREQEPELVIVDIRMPPTHSTEGLEAAHTIREEFPDTGILVLSAHVEIEHATELLATGHRIGYLPVDVGVDRGKELVRIEESGIGREKRRPRFRGRGYQTPGSIRWRTRAA